MREVQVFGAGLWAGLFLNSALAAGSNRADVPTVIAAMVPLYPPLALAASVQGVVVLPSSVSRAQKQHSIKSARPKNFLFRGSLFRICTTAFPQMSWCICTAAILPIILGNR